MSTVTFPSATTWITPRTLEVQVTTDNCVIILPQKIGEIYHVYFDITQFPLTVDFIVGDTTQRETTHISQIYTKAQDGTYVLVSPIFDVIHNVVEKSKYDTLLYINSAALTPAQQGQQLKNNCWYFTRESNEIVCLNNRISVILGQTNVFNNLVESAFYAQGYNSVYYYYSFGQYRPITGIFFSGDLPSSRFRIVYVPLGESVKLQVPKTNPQENEIQKYNFCCFCCNFIRNCRRLCSLICREQYKRHVFEKMSLLQATARNCTFFRMNKMLLWQFLLINQKVETGLT